MKTEKEIKERIKDLKKMQEKAHTKYDVFEYWLNALEWVLDE